MAAGRRVALAGGGDNLQALALAARDLKEGRRTHHPELVLLPCWGDLQDYASHDSAGREFLPLVNLVDTHGTDAILTAVAQLTSERQAQATVSTAHKAKGREWHRVLVARDKDPLPVSPVTALLPQPRSTMPKRDSRTSRSPGRVGVSTSAVCPGSGITPTAAGPDRSGSSLPGTAGWRKNADRRLCAASAHRHTSDENNIEANPTGLSVRSQGVAADCSVPGGHLHTRVHGASH